MELNPFTLVPHAQEKFNYLGAFDIQRWYDAVAGEKELSGGGCTMRSRPGASPRQGAQAAATLGDEAEAEAGHAGGAPEVINELERTIQNVIDTDFNGGAVFVRLSTQSPKDVGRGWTEHPRVVPIVREELAATESEGRTLNDRIRALFAASLRVMKVESGRGALDLLLKSERIQSSVLHALANAAEARWDLCVVVRAWEESMRLDREFRTFVVRDRVVAITQYNEYCHYPAWADQHQLIADKIHHLFVHQGLRDKVPRAYREWAYVADFVLLGEPEERADLRVQLVEINPFGPGTGASLFDWHTERCLLQAGHDLWGDLDSAAAAQPSDIDAWTKTVACRVGDGDDEQTVVVRMATRPNPRVDSSFLSSFGIDILVPALDDDDEEDDDDEDEDDDDDEEEEDENQEAIDEFVDEFVAEANLRPVVREHCAGRFVRR
ncbi:uncharacterized protein ACA1_355720, partial [Acanthamoeba castellanii str. Neff]